MSSFFVDRVRGMQDVLPPEGELWRRIESAMFEIASCHGFSYVRTPILEFTELFDRSAGESSDIVQKEMYTFDDKSGRSVTMRPEFTAGVLRAVASSLSGSSVFPLKLMYFGPCYRYEKPQEGRLREFFQFGLESFGGTSSLADFEIIVVANRILSKLGISDTHLEINAVGCSKCKSTYLDEIKQFFLSKSDVLCENCIKRLSTNPLRIFDCKNNRCQEAFKDAPETLSFICDDCKSSFEDLKRYLSIAKIPYETNTRIVRGLDYYTRLVFEFVTKLNGSNLTVCGGGRYDNLSKSLGGKDLPATGLAIGVERLIKIMKDMNIGSHTLKNRDLYIACVDESSKDVAVQLSVDLRDLNVTVDYDIMERSLKSQMRFADKMNYDYVLVLGSNEINSGILELKKLSDGSTKKFSLDNFVNEFFEFLSRK